MRLADFAASSLREKEQCANARSLTPPVYPDSKVPEAAEICARAPQYVVTRPSLRVGLDDFRVVELDPSGYALALTSSGVYLWRPGYSHSLNFPARAPIALFIPSPHGHTPQPGLAIVEAQNGTISVWESLSKAAIDVNHENKHTAELHLRQGEVVSLVAPVFPSCFVVATNMNRFFLANVRDDVHKFGLWISQLRSKSSLLSFGRDVAAIRRDVVAVRAGRALESNLKELLIANKHGDIAVWHVGLNGHAQLVKSVAIGTDIHMHMNQLYPNSAVSLLVHDVACTSEYRHVLASFAPSSSAPNRYLLVASFNLDFELVCVQRLLSHESQGALDFVTALHSLDDVLIIVTQESISFLEKPTSRPRWEETLALKQSTNVYGSLPGHKSIDISTSAGMIQVHVEDTESRESTTKSRLQQAVFYASSQNPLDLTKWPSFAFKENPEAAKEISVEIASSHSPFLPMHSASVDAHFTQRLNALRALHDQAPISFVAEILQTVAAAQALYQLYRTKKALVANLGTEEDAKNLFYTGVLRIPEILRSMSTAPEYYDAVVYCLEACANTGLPLPRWALLHGVIERVAARCTESAQPHNLASLVRLLCVINQQEPDFSPQLASRLLARLVDSGDEADARRIARDFKMYDTLTPIEVGLWQQSGDPSELISLIDNYGAEFANSLFSYCLANRLVKHMVKAFGATHQGLMAEFFRNKRLPELKWTLNPATLESTEALKAAAISAKTPEELKQMASLYKLSAYVTGQPLGVASDMLNLARAQEVLRRQLANVSTASTIVSHALPQLNSMISANEAVDLLALAPVQEVVENDDNLILGFSLVSAQDRVRQRLLVQKLLINTDWAKLKELQGSVDEDALKSSLFYKVYTAVDPVYQNLLKDFIFVLDAPSVDEVKQTYPWDTAGSVHHELADVAAMARAVVEDFDIGKILIL